MKIYGRMDVELHTELHGKPLHFGSFTPGEKAQVPMGQHAESAC